MSLEQAIEKLTAAVEAATGVLVTLGAANKAAAATPATPAPARGPGRPPKPPPAPPPPAAEDELGGDDGGLGGDDGGLDGGGETAVTAEEAKAAVLAYRDKAIKVKGKDDGLTITRALMKKFVANLEEIGEENAAEVYKAFTAALPKLK